ncbi:hypothetical protein LIER_12786 [Lithospermum erythrorhizon]|uniref:Uncharacterized protein n=1 Tax=Lithospermum erythrorhizon TaxID=34254 RepID=A0AAV3PTT7_LITER
MAPRNMRNPKSSQEEPTLSEMRRAELTKKDEEGHGVSRADLKGICDVVSNLIKEQRKNGDDDDETDAKWFTKFKRLNPPKFNC